MSRFGRDKGKCDIVLDLIKRVDRENDSWRKLFTRISHKHATDLQNKRKVSSMWGSRELLHTTSIPKISIKQDMLTAVCSIFSCYQGQCGKSCQFKYYLTRTKKLMEPFNIDHCLKKETDTFIECIEMCE